EDNTRMHEEVVRQIMEAHTVVPVEFGTTIKNERILRQLMSKAYNPVRECLKLVDNKVELGVKAVLDKDIVYFDREKGKESVFDILESLKNKASEVREGDLFSDRLFLNSSFLVEKDGMDEFSNEVTRLQDKYSMFKMLYSGPWAPYSFVYIKIGTEGLTIAKDKGRGAR
ncbi:MAG: GvpL/GvpF family gas vesicle protein, partial [Candidatus Bathyarchaeota archaeon]|nr:GvpL/GvpF family gas vesicle protein [Candidatus Bathyarchaeota archaeon]